MSVACDPTDFGMGLAIVGMAVRLPQSETLEDYWHTTVGKKACQTWFDKDDLIDEGWDPELVKNPAFMPVKPVISGVEHFDADFFGYSRAEAAHLDPKTRVFHEVAYHALEHAGYGGNIRSEISIGVFAGASEDPEWLRRTSAMLSRNSVEQFERGILAHKDLLAQLVAFHLDLHGPAYTLYTACSTSLAAVHMAAQSLLFGECDVAIAGGVTIDLPIKSGYLAQEGMIHSLDGYCRPFDAAAKGTLFGDGACAVVLKRLQDAVADRDHIHAVVRAVSANNDGHRKVGFSAPSLQGQSDLISTTLAMADVDPSTIGYVETHGTGTVIGDPVEFDALVEAFGTTLGQRCALGSVKANIGHTHAAAGVAGLIKSVLAIENATVPPMAHFQAPNPNMALEQSPFYIPTEPQVWPAEMTPRRAAVSSFGIGGTNLHAIIEQAPNFPAPSTSQGPLVYPVSAQTEDVAKELAERLQAQLSTLSNRDDFSRLAFCLQTKRREFPYRLAIVVSEGKEGQWLFEKVEPTCGANEVSGSVLRLRHENAVALSACERNILVSQAKTLISAVPSITSIAGQGDMLWLAAAVAGVMESEGVLSALAFAQSGALPTVPSRHHTPLTVLSDINGIAITPDQLADDGFWIGQLTNTAQAHPACSENKRTVGGHGLTFGLAETQSPGLERLLAELWVNGGAIDWRVFHSNGVPSHLAGPNYPFSRTPFPVPPAVSQQVSPSSDSALPKELTSVNARPDLSSTFRPAENQTELLVTGLMEQMLGIAPVGMDDDFFELGGHSLLATKLAIAIEKSFGTVLEIANFLEVPTAASICSFLASATPAQFPYNHGNEETNP
ncbi:polyketide synthase [Pseudovibrio sp. POLY-S9]|uniref:beta-ketoacyl synthase N-terminal-like domain-containing protein n=1 Tax=Pseudovibrio sp. POLY-S9 TaxID=1576596 RepID=UPI00070CBA7B|nr:polyketide synthase [Pseudovibrio sp. POLY-S9]